MRMLHGQEAVSHVLSVMLLVIITVASGLVLYSFVSGLVENQTQSVTTQPFNVLIDNVVFNGTCITVYVRNSLDQDVTVTRAYVNNEPSAAIPTTGSSATIPKNSTGKILIPGSYSSGSRYEIKLVLTSGHTLFTMEKY